MYRMLYQCREIAYQHQRALKTGQEELAQKILECDSPQEAKALSKCLVTDNHWGDTSFTLMYDICLEAAHQNNRYKKNILKTDDRILVEAIQSQFLWGSGVSHVQTRHIQPDHFPGQNKMGSILNVRKILREEEENTHIKAWHDTINQKEKNKNIFNTSDFPELTPAQNLEVENRGTPITKPQIKRKPTSTPSGGNDRKKLATTSHNTNTDEHELSNETFSNNSDIDEHSTVTTNNNFPQTLNDTVFNEDDTSLQEKNNGK